MLVKLVADTVKTQTATCGEVDMILCSADYSKLNVAICPNIKPTIAHYHPEFDEIYVMLDGWIHVRTFDPKTGRMRGSASARTRWPCSPWACTT